MLTKRQLQLLLFIDGHISKTSTAPSFEEMKMAVGLKSKSGIHRLISALEERGFVRRLPHRARALEVLKLPNSQSATSSSALSSSGKFNPSVVRGNFGNSGVNQHAKIDNINNTGNHSVAIPLYGRVAAGMPIEAVRDETAFIDVPHTMLGKGAHYALEVDGDSMSEAGIYDGDTAIIERCESAENGIIVVALIDESEVTLKRYRRKGESIALEPANQNYETRIFGPGRVTIQGKLSGLIRRYT